MSEINNGRLGLYGAEHLMTLGFKGLTLNKGDHFALTWLVTDDSTGSAREPVLRLASSLSVSSSESPSNTTQTDTQTSQC